MNTLQEINETAQQLPEDLAKEVLDFARFLAARRKAMDDDRRSRALATLTKYRGRFKAVKFSRDELYDRDSIR